MFAFEHFSFCCLVPHSPGTKSLLLSVFPPEVPFPLLSLFLIFNDLENQITVLLGAVGRIRRNRLIEGLRRSQRVKVQEIYCFNFLFSAFLSSKVFKRLSSVFQPSSA